MKLVRERPELLPLEIKLAGHLPDFWDPDDFIRIRNINSNKAINSARRAELACVGALNLDSLVHLLEPAWTAEVPEGLDPCSVKMSDLRRLELAAQSLPSDAGEEPKSAARWTPIR